MKRHRMNRKHSRKLFSATARGVHPKNLPHTVMRGGIRL